MKLSEKLLKAAYIFKKNPPLFLKYLLYRLKRLGPKWRKTYQGIHETSIGNVRFQIDFDQLSSSHYIKQVYFKCYELHLVELMKKYLKKGETFIDVGANIGYLSAVGADLVGKNGLVVSFEPVLNIFHCLKNIVTLNPDYNISVCNKAVSESNTPISMDCTSLIECGGNTAVLGLLDSNNVKTNRHIEVESTRLDQYIFDHGIGKVSLIKIDVEGYEFSVLKGLENYFLETSFRPVIVCELAPKAFEILGFTVTDLFSYMSKFGYQPYDIYDCRTKLTSKDVYQTIDVVFRVEE